MLVLTPNQANDLASMVVKSGKGINQLGFYEDWNEEKYLEYILLVVRNQDKNAGLLSLGVWAPKQWNKKEYYKT